MATYVYVKRNNKHPYTYHDVDAPHIEFKPVAQAGRLWMAPLVGRLAIEEAWRPGAAAVENPSQGIKNWSKHEKTKYSKRLMVQTTAGI